MHAWSCILVEAYFKSIFVCRLADLQRLCEERLVRSEEAVAAHEQFQESFKHTLAWTTKTQQRLNQSRETSGSRAHLQARKEQLQLLKNSLEEGCTLFDETERRADAVRVTSSAEGRKAIDENIQLLREEYEHLVDAIVAADGDVTTALSGKDLLT